MINTALNYTGSKFKLLEQILPHFDYSKPNFVDLFVGGGSVYTNILKLYDNIVINDIIPELIEIHKNINNKKFIENVKSVCPNKNDQQSYLNLRKDFNINKNGEKLFALMLSCTNNMMRFNNSFLFNQTFGKRSFNKNTELKILEWASEINKYQDKITYLSQHFTSIVIKPNTFYYIDPPYSNTEAGYNCYWNSKDDEILFNYCKKIDEIGSTFVLSNLINDKENRLVDLLSTIWKPIELDFNYKKVMKIRKTHKEILFKNF